MVIPLVLIGNPEPQEREKPLRISVIASVVLSCLMLAGCNPSTPKGLVGKGKVTLDGTPMTRGEVVFKNEQGVIRQGTIQADGTFSVPDIAPGNYSVGLTISQYGEDDYDVGNKGQKSLKKSAKPINLPAKLEKPETSGVNVEVADGKEITVTFVSK